MCYQFNRTRKDQQYDPIRQGQPMMRVNTCRDCGGSGDRQGDPRGECGTCLGTGEVD